MSDTAADRSEVRRVPGRERDAVPAWAGAALLAAAVVNVMAEAVVASAWDVRPYSYVGDYVNFLGSPFAGEFRGVVISSPLWFVMSAAWIATGALIAVAGVRLGRLLQGWRRVVVAAFAIASGIGLVLFAVFPLGPATVESGRLGLYLAGAYASIIAGNGLALTVGLLAKRLGLPRWVGVVGIVLGAGGLISAIATYGWVPIGLAERISVYTYLAWAAVTGIAVLAQRRSRPHTVRREAAA